MKVRVGERSLHELADSVRLLVTYIAELRARDLTLVPLLAGGLRDEAGGDLQQEDGQRIMLDLNAVGETAFTDYITNLLGAAPYLGAGQILLEDQTSLLDETGYRIILERQPFTVVSSLVTWAPQAVPVP